MLVPADTPSRQQRQTESWATLPVAVVAAGLRQFDVRLDTIDTVAVRKRHGCEAADPSSPPTLDDRPAGIERDGGCCYGWIRSTMSPRWRPAIR
jgi:hypothetical protein